jgi:hypothetical protein
MTAHNLAKRLLLTALIFFVLVSPAQAFIIFGGETIGRTWTVSGPGGNYGFVEFIAGSRSGTFIYCGSHTRFVRQPIEVVAGCVVTVPLVITSLLMLFLLRRRKGAR